MKVYFLFSLFFLSTICVVSQDVTFSDSSKISLITCSPGKQVYAKFGHTGLRVNDSINGIDVIFNYGIFSFNTENFYFKFIKGETDYQLGVQDASNFLYEYEQRNSIVWEQILNLTIEEKRRIIADLMNNYKPENRVYRYSFTFDNCATRPRDKVNESLNGQIQYKENKDLSTFREWVGKYVGEETWLKFGIDLIFGMDADAKCLPLQSMFLPEILMYEFDNAKISDKNNNVARNLVAKSSVIVQAKPENVPPLRVYENPLFFSLLVLFFGIVITFFEIKQNKYFKLFDSILLFTTGLFGLIVFYLMFVSVHPMVHNNLNILWLNPINIIAAIVIWFKGLRVPMNIYFIISSLMLVVLFISLIFSVQFLNIASIPLILLLLLRFSLWVLSFKKKYVQRPV